MNFEKIFVQVKINERNTVYVICCIHVQQQFFEQTKYHKNEDNGGSKVKNLPWRSLFFLSRLSISCHWSRSILLENIRKPEVFSFFLDVSKEISGVKCVEKTLLLVIYVFCFILLWFEILSQQNKHWVQKTVTELNFMKKKESAQKKIQKHYQ